MSHRAFHLFIEEFRDGKTNAELSNAMAELLQSVRDTGKAGKITLTISVKPAGEANSDRVIVTDDVKLSNPRPARSQDFFFVTDENALSRQHPRQRTLELSSVAEDRPTTFREIN